MVGLDDLRGLFKPMILLKAPQVVLSFHHLYCPRRLRNVRTWHRIIELIDKVKCQLQFWTIGKDSSETYHDYFCGSKSILKPPLTKLFCKNWHDDKYFIALKPEETVKILVSMNCETRCLSAVLVHIPMP